MRGYDTRVWATGVLAEGYDGMGVRHGLRSYSASGNAFARTLTQRILHSLTRSTIALLARGHSPTQGIFHSRPCQ